MEPTRGIQRRLHEVCEVAMAVVRPLFAFASGFSISQSTHQRRLRRRILSRDQ